MAEAVLIIDMPENCENCRLWHVDCKLWHVGDEEPEDFCGVDYRNINDLHERPDWCPLIPEPERVEEVGFINDFMYKCGWNACLDALEGKT